LLFKSSDVLLSNDLDTLLPNYLVSKIKGQKLVYDSHEYFTEVPELTNRPRVKKVWEKLEAYIFPKLKYVYTVNKSLADLFSKKYKVKVLVVKNVPNYKENIEDEKNVKFTFFYQGALNVDRGLEELICSFQYIEEDIVLEIAGTGDLETQLKNLVEKKNLSSKITFLGRIPLEDLKTFTKRAHIGVSLEKGTNLNYTYCLPNKLFDYISANIPVLSCELPEIKSIVNQYNIGKTIKKVETKLIADSIIQIYKDKTSQNEWIKNTKVAAKELCWEKEITVLDEIYL
jgi:glycosyltransferase involved in cell wall biosynthesis